MGKPYERELKALPTTYTWAIGAPIDSACEFLQDSERQQLVSVGSGGSFSAATFATYLHRNYTRQLAIPLTPLDFIGGRMDLSHATGAIFTAGGRNADALEGFRHLVAAEPIQIGVFCGNRNSPLAQASARHTISRFVEIAPPCGKDGFLATNSLLAVATILLRSYASLSGTAPLPQTLDELLPQEYNSDSALDSVCERIWSRDTLLVLHGPSTHAAAVDLESKFVEGALGNIQIADFRHFAHGRHYWLARHATTTAVVAFVASSDKKISDDTLAHLPNDIPVHCWRSSCLTEAEPLAALVHTLRLAGSAGRWLGVDPGKPNVPNFGRKIYSLASKRMHKRPTGPEEAGDLDSRLVPAITRKLNAEYQELPPESREFWKAALLGFLESLTNARIRAVVLDYDGTLCDTKHRFDPLEPAIASELIRLLDGGLLLGVATGRGRSAGERLREALPESYWSRVQIGYYNGGDIAPLTARNSPNKLLEADPILTALNNNLRSDQLTQALADTELRPKQLSITPKNPSNSRLIRRQILGLRPVADPNRRLKIFLSGHSIDIVSSDVSKSSVVRAIEKRLSGENLKGDILAIGDQGDPPGNDCELLSHALSISVHRVSADPKTCWNIAPIGVRGARASLNYLQCIEVSAGLAQFSINRD